MESEKSASDTFGGFELELLQVVLYIYIFSYGDRIGAQIKMKKTAQEPNFGITCRR